MIMLKKMILCEYTKEVVEEQLEMWIDAVACMGLQVSWKEMENMQPHMQVRVK